jgi:pimeloyl-ACP methyl ester carboxylesterase
LVHGLTSSKVAWRENILPLAERHHVYAVDLPGHGDSDKSNVDYDSKAIVGLMREFILGLGHQQVALAGISLGGGVSLLTALEHPEMVSKLVLCGSGALGREIAMVIRLAALPVVGEFMLSGPLDNIGAMARKCFYDKDLATSELVEELRRTNSLPGAHEAALTIIRRYISVWGVRRRYVVTNRLKSLDIPTMLFWGADDEIIPVEHAHRAAEMIPGAELHVFEKCGHWPQMERAEEFNRLMLAFLSRP